MEPVSFKFKNKVASFFEEGEEVVVGVSGGADSMALVHCLKYCGKKLQITVAHVNHNLRGNDSLCDEQFVRKWCLRNEIKFFCRSLNIEDISKAKKISVELAGRTERYKFFSEFNKTIVTAHTLSDKIETFFLNIARGTSLKGLCSIPAVRGIIKRPFICFTRSEIEAYCFENGLCYRTDLSNFSAIYSRNKIRLKIIPEFKKLNSNFEVTMLKMFNNLQIDENFFDVKVEQILNFDIDDEGLNLNNFIIADVSVQKRVIAKFLRLNEIEVSSLVVNRVFELIKKGYGRISLPGLKEACCSSNKLTINPLKHNEIVEFDFELPNFVEISHKNFVFIRIKIGDFAYFLKKCKHWFLFKVDYDKIKGRIHFRTKFDGDKIKLINRPTKKLKCLMQESGFSAARRKSLMVLSDNFGVFWAQGFGCDVRVMCNSETENLMLVCKKN